MKEARSVAAALFAFAVFLLLWALLEPGAAHSRHGARFLRMRVEETSHGRTEAHTVSVPTFVVNGVLRGASVGRFHRQLDLDFDRDVPCETLREAWAELEKSPDGTDVTRKIDEDEYTFRRDGTALAVTIHRPDDEERRVVLRVPLSLAKTVMSQDRDLDAEAILAGLRELGRGDLVDVQDRDHHVKIWLE